MSIAPDAPPIPHWYDDRENLRWLFNELHNEGLIALGDVSYFLEKPWKWDKEWEHLNRHKNLSDYEE